jgi:DNA-binding response OmpR family regulator
MSPTMNFVPTSPSGPERISLLLVSTNAEDLTALRNILHHRDWNILHCATVTDARTHLKKIPTSVVVTDSMLPDGSWKDLIDEAERMREAPLVLVTSRHADERLWAEVLNMGGYDVLLKPFDRNEVARVVGMAWRCWMGSFRKARPFRRQYAAIYA